MRDSEGALAGAPTTHHPGATIAGGPDLRFVPVEEFAAVDEPGAEALASTPDGGVLIPAAGIVLIYGDGGAGKTTLSLDLAFALASGESWLNLIEPERPLRVAIVENEGPRPEFRRKLRRKLASVGDRDGRMIVVLEGVEDEWAALTLSDERHRTALAQAIADQEVDLVVLGPLVSAGEFPTGGTPDEIRRFEGHVHDLRRRAERPFALLLVHHESKGGRVSGAWERLPDTLVRVTAQGNGRTGLDWQKARWASERHNTSTTLRWADGETYTVEEKPAPPTDDDVAERIVAYVGAHPGTSWRPIEQEIRGVGNDRCRKIRDSLLANGGLVNLTGAVRSRETARIYLPDAPEAVHLRPASGAALAQPEEAA